MSAQACLNEEYYELKSEYTNVPNQMRGWKRLLKPSTYSIFQDIYFEIRQWRHSHRELSYGYLARISGFSKRTVVRAVIELLSYRLITKMTRRKNYLEHEINVYQINFDVLFDAPKVKESIIGGSDTGVTHTKKRVLKERITTPKPPLEKKNNQSKDKAIAVVVFPSLNKLDVTDEFRDKMMALKKGSGERYSEEEVNIAVEVTLSGNPHCIAAFFRMALVKQYELKETEESLAIKNKEFTKRAFPSVAKRAEGYSSGLVRMEVLSKGVEFVRGNIVEFLEYTSVDFKKRLINATDQYLPTHMKSSCNNNRDCLG